MGYQQSPAQNAFSSPANTNKSISGPPTQSLFDSLHTEKLNMQQSPTRGGGVGFNQSQNIQMGTSNANQSFIYNQSLNESYFNQSNYTSPRVTSPTQDFKTNSGLNSSTYASQKQYNNFWITVYGFPPTAVSMIITHFTQCGTIVDKVFPPQSGNWIHLKYMSRLECDKALNYNEKILNNSLMIGVTRCKDPCVGDKENFDNE